MEKLNDLSFERLQLVGEYTTLQRQLNDYLDIARQNISKAKTINGIALTSLVQPDTHDMEPTTRIQVKGQTFTLLDSLKEDEGSDSSNSDGATKRKPTKAAEEKTEDINEPEQGKKIPNFRPFGVLEPSSAKQARKDIHHSLELCCELASLQQRICQLDDEMRKCLQESKKDDEFLQSIKALRV